MEKKIQRVQIGQFEAHDRSVNLPVEMASDGVACDMFLDQRIPLRAKRDQSDVGSITLVTRSRVRDTTKLNVHQTISTCVETTLLSISAGQYATMSSTFGRPPANPVTLGGPLRTSGAISRVNLSTARRSEPRTPTRSCTSG